jgi:hypothetical protein
MSARFTGFLFLRVNARRHTSGIPSWAVSLLVVPQRQVAVRFIVDVGRKPDVERRPCSSGTAREHLQQTVTVPDIAVAESKTSAGHGLATNLTPAEPLQRPASQTISRSAIRMLVLRGALVGPCSFNRA